jgi:L,D-transpeptidase YcbB
MVSLQQLEERQAEALDFIPVVFYNREMNFCRFHRKIYLLHAVTSFLLSFFLLSAAGQAAEYPVQSDVSSLLKKRFTGTGSPPKIIVRSERLLAAELLADFYKKLNYRPVWTSFEGPLKRAESLVDAVRNVGQEGLLPEHYHLSAIESLLSDISSGRGKQTVRLHEMLADLELLLTDSYLMLGCHFSAGCVNPVTLKAEGFIYRDELDITTVFEKAIREDKVKESLQGLLPHRDEYTKLRQYLLRYRETAAKGGWPLIPEGKKLRKGETDDRVFPLRERLIIGGYIGPKKRNSGKFFDSALEQAVIRFQKQHGLDTDGVVGHRTLKELNVPARARVRQIELNMERLRWLSGNLGERYIKVNIADFTLDVVEADRNVLHMKVVVGKPFWHTPVFSEKMRYLVMNPPWNVPRSIALEEVIPKIQRDPGFLRRENMKVLQGWDGDGVELDPAALSWANMSEETFRYRFRQNPGPRNPLGTIKFMFPNRFGVYLHDTPSKRLFDRSVRSFSHGCIRLENPLDLAEYVLKKDTKWTRDRIIAKIKKGQTKEVRLADEIMVHILYLTAWVDGEGMLHFRDDIYGRDAKLDEELRKQPPAL